MLPHDALTPDSSRIDERVEITETTRIEKDKRKESLSAETLSLLSTMEETKPDLISSKKEKSEIIKLKSYCNSHTLEESHFFIKKKLKKDVIKLFARQIAKSNPSFVHQSAQIAQSIYSAFTSGSTSSTEGEKLAKIDRALLSQMEDRVHDLETFRPDTKTALMDFAATQLSEIERENKSNPVHAATVIQRAFRKHLYRQKVKKEKGDPKVKAELIQTIKTLMAEEWSVKVQTRPAKPFSRNRIDPEKVEAYLKTQAPDRREVLERILKSSIIKNISFEKFQASLASSINDFLEYLGSLPEQERGYVIVADKPEKSTNWVVGLCAPQLAHQPPKDVMQNVQLMDHLEALTKQTPPVRHILMIDDGSYSGEQLARYINEMVIPAIEKTKQPLTIHFVVPFMTQYAKEAILKEQTKDIPIRISHHQMMISIADLPKYLKKLDESDLIQLREIISGDMAKLHSGYTKNLDKPLESRTLTYFEHKLADFASTADWIIEAIIAKTPTIYKPGEVHEVMEILATKENQAKLADIHADFPDSISLVTTDKGTHLYIKDVTKGMEDQEIDGTKEGVVSIMHSDGSSEILFVGDIVKLEEGDIVGFNPYGETATFSKGQLVKNSVEEAA